MIPILKSLEANTGYRRVGKYKGTARQWQPRWLSWGCSWLAMESTARLSGLHWELHLPALLPRAGHCLLVVQHDVRDPDHLRGHADGGDVVEVGRVPAQLVVAPLLAAGTQKGGLRLVCWWVAQPLPKAAVGRGAGMRAAFSPSPRLEQSCSHKGKAARNCDQVFSDRL